MISLLKSFAPLALYVMTLIVLFLSLAGNVRWGLLFLVPLLPLQNVIEKLYALPLGKDLNDILLVGMLVGWFIAKAAKGEPVLARSSYNVILFLYFFYTYFTLWKGSFYLGEPAPINPLDPRLQNWKNYMVLPLLFFLTANNLRNKSDFKKMLILMCSSVLVMNVYNIRQISWMTSWVSRSKIPGTFVWLGANEVAAFYATYTFVLIGIFFLIKRRLIKIFLGCLILSNFYIVLFMFSRGAYIAVLMGLLMLSIVRVRKLIIPILLMLMFWQAVLPQRVIERIKFSEQEGALDDSAQTRLILWQQSMIYFQENPLFGVGYDVFSKIGMKRDTHNVFLRTLAEQGLIGLGFLLTILVLALKRGWRLYRRADDPLFKGLGLGFFTCVIAVMAGNFFGDRWTPLPLAAYFWVFLGMVERGNVMADEILREQSPGRRKQRAGIS